jgi:Uma2 family endonuclease
MNRHVLTIAPEICVEVLSPSNLRSEIAEKKRLSFEAGAEAVWICDLEGRLFVYLASDPEVAERSRLCPSCPEKIGS